MTGRLVPSLPTATDDWQLMARTTRLVLTAPGYAAFAAFAAVAALSTFVLTRNLSLLTDVVLFGSLPVDARVSILLELYPFVGDGYTDVTGALLAFTAGLVGVDLSLVAYHLVEHDLSVRTGSGGVTGVLLGTLGAGCASCGSALLAGVLSIFGAGGATALLPLDGLEFVVVSVVGLVLSIHWIAQALRGGQIRGCPVEV